ncbi:MAG: MFS transporter [Comamonas sp.]
MRRKRALFVYFFIPGLALASWVTRTPAIRDGIQASIAEMGMVLLGLSLGSMTGVLCAGKLVGWRGTRWTALLGLWLVLASLVTMAAGTLAGQQFVVAAGLALFGLGMGAAEIAVNMDGAEVERKLGRPVLHALHGCFSLGTLTGALLGYALSGLGVAAAWHLGAVALLVVPLILCFWRDIPAGTARVAGSVVSAKVKHRVWSDPRVLWIGLIVFAMALAEGAANDWLPILMVDEHGFSEAAGSLIFVAFAAAMTLGRFGGGGLLQRFGRVTAIRLCAGLGALGIALVVFSSHPLLAGAAVFLWGIGASLGFPVALSAAGDGGEGAADRVKAVAIIGYVALLVGPPMLGFLGEAHGLRSAMLVVLLLVVAAAVMAPALRAQR